MHDVSKHRKDLSLDVKAEMASRGIMIKEVAAEVHRHGNTIRLWLLQGMTPERYEGLMKAINRIVEKREGD